MAMGTDCTCGPLALDLCVQRGEGVGGGAGGGGSIGIGIGERGEVSRIPLPAATRHFAR